MFIEIEAFGYWIRELHGSSPITKKLINTAEISTIDSNDGGIPCTITMAHDITIHANHNYQYIRELLQEAGEVK